MLVLGLSHLILSMVLFKRTNKIWITTRVSIFQQVMSHITPTCPKDETLKLSSSLNCPKWRENPAKTRNDDGVYLKRCGFNWTQSNIRIRCIENRSTHSIRIKGI